MGCFCREAVQALKRDPDDTPDRDPEPQDERVAAVADWLAARWLPSPEFEPEPEWQNTELVEPPMPPEALAVVTALVQAQQACEEAFEVDPAEPEQVPRLARIIATLNRRSEALRWVEQEEAPWEALALRNDRVDSVREAIEQQVLAPDEDEPQFREWRELFAKLKALAPLVAIGQLTETDLSEPDAPEQLARRVRKLRQAKLPPLADPPLILRTLARAHALARLQQSFGADPSRHDWTRVEQAIARKEAAVADALPPEVRVRDGRIEGMPTRQPNPSQIINPEMIRLAERILPDSVERMRWQVPAYQDLDLLTTAAPVATLGRLLRVTGANPVRLSPCGRQCDAGAAMRDLEDGKAGQATDTSSLPASASDVEPEAATGFTGLRDSGTGAGPAG